MTWNQPPNIPHKLKPRILFIYTLLQKYIILLKDASLVIIDSDVEGELVTMHSVIIGIQAKYMLEILNCWSMASTSACFKYHEVL